MNVTQTLSMLKLMTMNGGGGYKMEVVHNQNFPEKTYMKLRIAGYGHSEAPIFYYDLTSIAMNYLGTFRAQNELGRRWNKIPKNVTDCKPKIISRLLAMRKYNETLSLYKLDQ